MARAYTNKLLELVDEEMVDKNQLILELLTYMSEDEVKDFYNRKGYADEIDQLENAQEVMGQAFKR